MAHPRNAHLSDYNHFRLADYTGVIQLSGTDMGPYVPGINERFLLPTPPRNTIKDTRTVLEVSVKARFSGL
jgi:hypothetical protein